MGAKTPAPLRRRDDPKNDTHFYVGAVHQRSDACIIVGLFHPPVRSWVPVGIKEAANCGLFELAPRAPAGE